MPRLVEEAVLGALLLSITYIPHFGHEKCWKNIMEMRNTLEKSYFWEVCCIYPQFGRRKALHYLHLYFQLHHS